MKVIQWVLVVPAGIAAWFLVLILGFFAAVFIESCCPPEEVVSGYCTADWYPSAMDLLEQSFAGLSAFAVVLASTLVAPDKHKLVAMGSFVAGAIVVGAMFESSPHHGFGVYLAAIAGGLIGVLVVLLFIQRIYPRRNNGA